MQARKKVGTGGREQRSDSARACVQQRELQKKKRRDREKSRDYVCGMCVWCVRGVRERVRERF